VAGWAAIQFALRQWVFPALRRHAAPYERARAALADELGREPLTIEISERMRELRVAAAAGG